MLTQIEWWGGVIFVLGALTYRMVMGALERNEQGVDWYRLRMHAFYLAPAAVLAGYFYPLAALPVQYAYVGLLVVASLLAAVMLVQEVTGDAAPEPGEGDAGARRVDAADGDDEPGWLLTALGSSALYSPVLVACGLGWAKAWPLAQQWPALRTLL